MEKSPQKKGEEDEASAIDGRKSMSSAGVHIYTNRQFLLKSTPLWTTWKKKKKKKKSPS